MYYYDESSKLKVRSVLFNIDGEAGRRSILTSLGLFKKSQLMIGAAKRAELLNTLEGVIGFLPGLTILTGALLIAVSFIFVSAYISNLSYIWATTIKM